MSPDLGKIVHDLREGRGPSIMLLFGDAFRVREATKAILDVLAPGSGTTLSAERYDGRTCAWDQVEAALRTPSLFAATHTVVVDDAPYFAPAQRKGSVLERALGLWREGQMEAGGHAFMGFLSAEGWTPEQWLEAEGPAPGNLARDYGGDAGEIEALWRFCREQELPLKSAGSSEQSRLENLIEKGLPEGAFLVMRASQVDRRARLFKKMVQACCVLDLSLERDRSGRIRRESLAGFLEDRLRQAGKRIEARARETILARSGDELWALHQELEKLLLYIGDAPLIRAGDVEEIFTDQSEGWVFNLTDALGRRDLLRALSQLRRLLDNGEYPLRLLGAIASEVRRLLQSRELLDKELGGRWRRGISFKEFQRMVAPDMPGLPTKSPYVNYLTLQRAEQFTLQELNRYRRLIQEADMRLKSSGQVAQAAMERLLIEMSLGR